MIKKTGKPMKKYNSLYVALSMMFVSNFHVWGMDLTESIFLPPSELSKKPQRSSQQSFLSQSNVLATELTKSQSLDKDEAYDEFKQTCSQLPYLFNSLKLATQANDLNQIKDNITRELSSSIEFIKQRDTSTLDPQSSQRIKRLNEIKEAIEGKKPHTNVLIDQWKKTVEISCNLTINNIEKIKSGDISTLERSSLI